LALNYIWIGFFLVAFVVGLIKLIFLGDVEVFSDMMAATFVRSEVAINIALYLMGIMTLWLGIMKIGEKGGAIKILSRAVSPLFTKLFPDLPKDHPATGAMMMNISANMLGLGNAATPLGIKAMEELQKENKEKDTATNAQIMFLVLNTSGLTLIPLSVMALRFKYGAQDPTEVFVPILLATYFATLAGLIVVSLYQRINLFNKTVLLYLGTLTAAIVGLIILLNHLPSYQATNVSRVGGNLILFSIIIGFLILGVRKKLNLYSTFIEGAKEGFTIAVKVIPYLVAILVAIGVFQASGALELFIEGIHNLVLLFTGRAEFVDALPVAFLKPLSGSGAEGMMINVFETHGVDSFAGKLASTLQGSTETTFYVLAVYFGAVGIKKTRYAVTAGLLADLAGIIAAIFIAYLFFG
jgi:spore maturation protein SpmA